MEAQETLQAAKPSPGRPEMALEEQQPQQLSIPSEPQTAVMRDVSVISGITDAEDGVIKTDEEQQKGLEDAEQKVPEQVILPPVEDSSNGPAAAAESTTAAEVAAGSTAAAMANDGGGKPQAVEAAAEPEFSEPLETQSLPNGVVPVLRKVESSAELSDTVSMPAASPSRNQQDDNNADMDEYIRSPEVQNSIVERSPGNRYVRFLEKLGSGASKDVYRAYDTQEGIEVAWNVVNLSGVPKNERNRIVNEVRLLERLHHHNIISFHGSWVNRERQEVNFVTEILSSGTLKSFVNKVQVIRWKIAKRWATQILQGLDYLHSQDPPVIHRDLKCDNIFINGTSGDLRIGDLGLSTTHRQGRVLSVLGTPEFMAPDMYEETSYDEKVDIYAFGMCLLEIFTQEIPYSECNNPAQIYKKVSNGEPPEVLSRLQSKHAREFVLLCLGHKDEHGKFIRPTAAELLKHPFLLKRGTDNDEVVVDPPLRERPIAEAAGESTVSPVGTPVVNRRLVSSSSAAGGEADHPDSVPPLRPQHRVTSLSGSDDDDDGDRFDEMPESETNMRKVKVLMGRDTELQEDEEKPSSSNGESSHTGETGSDRGSQISEPAAVQQQQQLDSPQQQQVPVEPQQSPPPPNYLVAAAVLENESLTVRPYADDILKLVVTLPVDGQRQNVQFDFHMVGDDAVQVAKEMVRELGIPQDAVLEISETISGLACAARMKQEKYASRMNNVQNQQQQAQPQDQTQQQQQQQQHAFQQAGIDPMAARSAAEYPGNSAQAFQAQRPPPVPPPPQQQQQQPFGSQGAGGVQAPPHSVAPQIPSQSPVPDYIQMNALSQGSQLSNAQGQQHSMQSDNGQVQQPVYLPIPPQGAYAAPPTNDLSNSQHLSQQHSMQGDNGQMQQMAQQPVYLPIPPQGAYAAPPSNDPSNSQHLSQQVLPTPPPQIGQQEEQPAYPKPPVPQQQQHHGHALAVGQGVSAQVPERAQNVRSQGIPRHQQSVAPPVIAAAQDQQGPPQIQASIPQIQRIGERHLRSQSTGSDVSQGKMAMPPADAMNVSNPHIVTRSSSSIASMPSEDGDDDDDEEEGVDEDLRKLDEVFQKNLQRAQKVFDNRMDNLQRSHIEREAQHQKTLEKHEKERVEFEKRLAQEAEQQQKRIVQLQREWDKKREDLAQKKNIAHRQPSEVNGTHASAESTGEDKTTAASDPDAAIHHRRSTSNASSGKSESPSTHEYKLSRDSSETER